jgi:EAL domain-containing protein (putative c-di-GMP-specific phosphodiesterase class I)/AmiR/NasT family two-component response regulator
MNSRLVVEERSSGRLRDAHPAAGGTTACSALVIDDDEFVCRAVAAQLRNAGAASVTAVSNPLEAVQLLNQGGPFDLIISDLSMPTFDGIQMMRLISARQPQAAVLLMSSADSRLLSSAEALARGRGLRVMGAVGKPLKLDDLRRVMKDLLQAPDTARNFPDLSAPDAAALRQALNSEQIRVYVQPQIDAQTGSLHGVEALARWDSPQHGSVPPACFIPIAERSGLIDALTESILAKSLAACGAWRKAGLVTRISVNAPISSMCSLVLPDTIVALADRRGMEPNQLTLEITESGFMEDPVRALDVLTRLRLRNVDLAIDDFGCGYSSLQQLKRMPFNELKIDCSFVMAMLEDAESRSIVRSSIQLCQELGLRSVAEGVESRAHWDALREMGCDVLQGYHISRPVPVEQFPAWWSRRAPAFRR